MKYLLDTNICIYLINERPKDLLNKFEQYSIDEFGISSITHAELQYGIAKSTHKEKNKEALDQFLLPLTILPFHGEEVTACYGKIRALLESKGETIGPFDMLIAAHALSLNLILISNNMKEFTRIPGLKLENWVS